MRSWFDLNALRSPTALVSSEGASGPLAIWRRTGDDRCGFCPARTASVDRSNRLRRALPDAIAYRITRRLNIARQRFIFDLSHRHPWLVRRLIRAMTKHQLPEGYAVDRHFKLRYNPWDERLAPSPTVTCSRPSARVRPRW
jgi:cation diffusion facilitator CzcD-associated flavoprotein CzcO